MNPASINPMLLQAMSPIDPKAQKMRELMMIMGGLGQNVPPQVTPQVNNMMPILGGIAGVPSNPGR